MDAVTEIAPAAERRMIMATEFNTQVGNGEYRLQFETDNKAHYLIMQSSARRCVDCEHMTNADRIRSMSDEELATHLHDIGWDCHLCAEHGRLDNEPLIRGEKCDEKCVEHCLEWLKQPAEVSE